MSGEAFGIDFGTTNSALAYATSSTVETIPLDDRLPPEWAGSGFDRILPSVIGFSGRTPVFGWAAKKGMVPKLAAVKRLFATDDTVDIGGHRLTVEEAAAVFFRYVQGRAAAVHPQARLDQAVVTIPANSRGLARVRTKVSAGLAGIKVLALINEPTAAAMAHARAIGQNQRILVFDWGGGTLDVTVLLSIDGTFVEQSSKGIQRLGGVDIDAAFLAAVLPRLPGSADWRAEQHDQFRLDLELAKIELSTRTATEVAVPGGGRIELTRGFFEEVARPLVRRTLAPVEVCLRESPGRIDRLVMVGGSSKIPSVQRTVIDRVGAEPASDVDPMTAVAEGAAIASGILQDIITDLDFFVGTEHALGTIVADPTAPDGKRFAMLIRRNTKYPARATERFEPHQDYQEKVDVEVLEGDPEKPINHEDNVVLKVWSIDLPERRLRSDAAFDITYEYDVDGILHVRVRDLRTDAVLMDEELAVGAAEDPDALAAMRERIDRLMPGPPTAKAAQVIATARNDLLPFLGAADRALLASRIAAAQTAPPHLVAARIEELEQEMARHTYLL